MKNNISNISTTTNKSINTNKVQEIYILIQMSQLTKKKIILPNYRNYLLKKEIKKKIIKMRI